MASRTTSFRIPLFSAALLLAACAQVPPSYPRSSHLEEELYDFQALQKRFVQGTELPATFDFPGHGRVTVRELSLDGYPGNTYVRCRFHYENTTGRPVVQTWVTLDVLDGQGRIVGSQASRCIVPIPAVMIVEGAFFADELRTQTFGVHDQPGWLWRITCKSQLEEPETGG